MHLASLLLSSFVATACAIQIPLTTQSRTLVDALGDDKDFESLLVLLQRTRLIPTLNRLDRSTLFAPTNDAIKKHASPLWNSIISDGQFVVTDNVKEKLRQQLFYHLLNYTISGMPSDEKPQTQKTLHYPNKSLDPPSREPPPSPPWMPLPTGTLGNQPQRLRTSSRDQKAWVGVDAFGNGGAEVTKGLVDAGNGVLMGISEILEPPPDLAKVVSAQPSLSYFRRILTPDATKVLENTSELTLFLPVDKAWEQLNRYERIYLESDFATDDLRRILNMHATIEHGVKWSDSFNPGLNLTTIDGTTVEIITTADGTRVADGKLIQPDVYASNGVLHLVSSLLIPEGALKITPEKYLLSLNCTSFVSLLHSANLEHLINNPDTKYTILAPQDDVLSLFGGSELPEKGTPELMKMLQYHFIPGHWPFNKLRDGMLLQTSLEEEGLKGESQVLTVDVNGSDKGGKSIQFGGAGIIGDPIEVDNIIVYFVSRPIVPPADAISTALPSLDLSTFLAAVLSSNEAEVLKTTPRTSLLLPYNSAFRHLGLLVSSHLLSPSSKSDLEKVLLHHTLTDVEYAGPLVNGSQQTFQTLEGSDIKLERLSNGTVLVSPSGAWPGMKARLVLKDTLTQTGVIHELTDILLPRSVDITIGKLVKAAKGSTMANMVNRAGFEWILNGTAPPEDSPWAEKYGAMIDTGGVGWTLLCPMDEAFKQYNLTQLFANTERLKAIVEQHIIPTPIPNKSYMVNSGAPSEGGPTYSNLPLALEDDASYSTLRKSELYGDVVFKLSKNNGEDGEKQFIVGIKGARGTDGETDWAKIISWGRTTTSGSSYKSTDDFEGFTAGAAGGVIQIDRLLSPYKPSWWHAYGAPTLGGTVGIMAILGFFWTVRRIWRWDVSEATYEPVGGYSRDDDEE